jgi:hypothetical protein
VNFRNKTTAIYQKFYCFLFEYRLNDQNFEMIGIKDDVILCLFLCLYFFDQIDRPGSIIFAVYPYTLCTAKPAGEEKLK